MNAGSAIGISTIVGVALVGADPTSFITALVLMVFPIIVLIVLTRPNIKAAFQSGGF